MSGSQQLEVDWYLEGFADDARTMLRVPIRTLPFAIGRRPGLALTLHSDGVSSTHAEIFMEDEVLHIRDLNSTNGTFVNRKRLQGAQPLKEGDILHFASMEFRLCSYRAAVEAGQTVTASLQALDLPQRLVGDTAKFREMILRRRLAVVFQPILKLADHQIIGYEALGRGTVEGLPTSPLELFTLAANIQAEVELSDAFRELAAKEARALPGTPLLFVNTHPAEVHQPQLLGSMRQIRETHPDLPVVLEIHESAVTDVQQMREFRANLAAMQIPLAYDDFGAGQARLIELVEVPPTYLKFDMCLVRDLHLASQQKQRMVHTLVQMVLDFGIQPVAEGVECEAEGLACEQLGFSLAQGFHYGRPALPRAAGLSGVR